MTGTCRNLLDPKTLGTDSLLYLSAFVAGFGDGRNDKPFRCPEKAQGPFGTLPSAQLAYEHDQQFAAIWRTHPLDLSAMIEPCASLQRIAYIGL